MSKEAPEVQEQGDRPSTVTLAFHRDFVREVKLKEAREDGRDSFFVATMPKGHVVDGQDVSGMQLTSNFANPGKQEHNQNMLYIPVLTHTQEGELRPVRLTKDLGEMVEQGDGTRKWEPELGKDGDPLEVVAEVSPYKLRETNYETNQAFEESRAHETTMQIQSKTSSLEDIESEVDVALKKLNEGASFVTPPKVQTQEK